VPVAAVAHRLARLPTRSDSGVPWTPKPHMRNALIGLALAAAAAAVAINPKIYGIDLWKIVLGVIGLALIRAARPDRKR
jgi:hypothetical protein